MDEKQLVINNGGGLMTNLMLLLILVVLAVGLFLVVTNCCTGEQSKTVVLECGNNGQSTTYQQNCNCDLTYEPVCGVDGNTYLNPTGARLVGVDIAYYGICNEENHNEEVCYDSDGGKNFEVWGYVTKGQDKKEDVCEKGYLVEYYCENNEIRYVAQKCNCEDGKCIEQTCEETDDGDDPYHFGKVAFNGKAYADYCVSGTNQYYTAAIVKDRLVEYYCDGNQVKNKTYTCDYGCENGACRQEPEEDNNTYCTDSDGGLDYYTKGVVTGMQSGDPYTYEDECVVQNTGYTTAYVNSNLKEYYCENGEVKYKMVQCNCRDGVCVEQ